MWRRLRVASPRAALQGINTLAASPGHLPLAEHKLRSNSGNERPRIVAAQAHQGHPADRHELSNNATVGR